MKSVRPQSCPLVSSRRGLALLVVLIAIGLASAMGVSLMKLTLAHRRQAEREVFAAQARWLAESGMDRAAALLRDNPQTPSQSWSIKAEELDSRNAARVAIDIQPIEKFPQRRQVTVTADFPAETLQRARVTVTRFVDLIP